MTVQESQQAIKRNNIYLLLAAAFVTNAVLAEIIGSRIFSFEKTLGIDPLNIDILAG